MRAHYCWICRLKVKVEVEVAMADLERITSQPEAYERVQDLAEKGFSEIPSAYIRPLEERPSISESIALQDIPVIDLSSETSPDLSAKVGLACREWGFFQVLNHGVPLELLERMRHIGAQFFAMSLEDKLVYACKDTGSAPEGYGSRMLVKEEQVLDWRDYIDHHTLPITRRNPERWPSHPPEYRSVPSCASEWLQTRFWQEPLVYSKVVFL